MLVSMAGLVNCEPGQIIEVDEDEGRRLIAAGFAVQEPEIEVATFEPPEKAILLAAKRKRGR